MAASTASRLRGSLRAGWPNNNSSHSLSIQGVW